MRNCWGNMFIEETVENRGGGGNCDIALWLIFTALKIAEIVGEHCDVELLGKNVQCLKIAEKVESATALMVDHQELLSNILCKLH